MSIVPLPAIDIDMVSAVYPIIDRWRDPGGGIQYISCIWHMPSDIRVECCGK